MQNRITLIKCLAVVLALAVQNLAAAADAADPTAATVNGVAIKRSAITSIARSAPPGQQRPDAAIIEELVNVELLAQQAKAKGLDKTADFIAEMNNQHRALLAKAVVTQLLTTTPIKEEDVQKFYQQQLQSGPRNEYRIRHILSKSEADAKAVISELDKGTDFAAVAKERSTDASAAQGGELGWIEPSRLPKTFGEGLMLLSKGSYSKSPVLTSFGWHVIKVDDMRDLKPAPFEQVKDQLRMALQNKMVTEYILELKKKAKIEVK